MDKNEKMKYLFELWYTMGKTYFKTLDEQIKKVDDPLMKTVIYHSAIMGFIDSSMMFVRKNLDEIEKDPPAEIKVDPPKKKYKKAKRSVNAIDTWIKNNNIKQFRFKDLRKVKSYRKGLMEHYLSKMIADKTIVQISKDRFVVNK